MTIEELRLRVSALVEERGKLVNAAVSETRGLTDDENTRVTAIDGERSALKLAIEDAEAAETRKADQDEARKASGLATIPTVDAKVTNEPATYSRHAKRSFYWDMAQAVDPRMPEHDAAVQRLSQHNHEVSFEVAQGTKAGELIERSVRSQNRSDGGEARLAEMRKRGASGSETRALTTGTGSGGAFAPPVYLLDLYAPYRTAGRAFINTLAQHELPDTGMTIDIPAIGAAAGVTTQSTQNTGVGETDPTASYLTANVTTLAGEITVSQQLLDRTGPWQGSYDAVMFDQLTREYNTQADTFALTAALTGATAVAYTSGSPTMTLFYSKVNGAQAGIRTAAGTFRNPTAMFLQPNRWSFLAAQVDTAGRPLIVPNAQSPMNAISSGGQGEAGSAGIEGFTGYNMAGLDVYQDASIPTPGTGADQAIVLDPSAVLNFEGDLVPRVLPQTLGNQLSVILQVYSYIAVLPLYPAAVAAISGTGMATITF